MCLDFDARDTFSQEEALLWIMDFYFSQKMLDLVQLKMLINWWTGVLTAPIHCRASIDSHSDGTHSLQRIHWLSFWRHPFTAAQPLTLILTAPIHCSASIDSHSDGTHSLQRIHWLSFWRHPFTAEHPLTLILTAPIHCSASIDSHSDGTHSLQRIHWLSFWRHPFTAAQPLTLILMAPIHCSASIDSHSDGTHSLQSIRSWDTFLQAPPDLVIFSKRSFRGSCRMRYCSTRAGVQGRSFRDVLFSGYAADGGMFMPETLPSLSAETLRSWSRLSYQQLLCEICSLYISELEIPRHHLERECWGLALISHYSLKKLLFISVLRLFQISLYSAFYDTIVANQLYRKLSLYYRFIYYRNFI